MGLLIFEGGGTLGLGIKEP